MLHPLGSLILCIHAMFLSSLTASLGGMAPTVVKSVLEANGHEIEVEDAEGMLGQGMFLHKFNPPCIYIQDG